MVTEFSPTKRLINPGTPAAHPEPAYRCFLPDLTGFTGPRLRRTRAHERNYHTSLEIEDWKFSFAFPIFSSFAKWRRGWDLNPR
jgi:hypothetical protein